MAGSQVTTDILQLQKQRLGYQGASLTNFDNDNEPQVAAGSKVEVGGALFEFAAPESITGWAGIGNGNDVYIKLTVAGVSITASFTTSPPAWSTSKQGFYDALERYLFKLYKDAGGNYTNKHFLLPLQREEIGELEIADGAIKEDELATDAVTTAKIKNAAVTGAKVANNTLAISKITKTITGGTQVIADSGEWIIPEGLIQIVQTSGGVGDLKLTLYVSGAWRSGHIGGGETREQHAWTVRSDGTNMKLQNEGDEDATVYYQRFT